MVIFNSYVKLPEGIFNGSTENTTIQTHSGSLLPSPPALVRFDVSMPCSLQDLVLLVKLQKMRIYLQVMALLLEKTWGRPHFIQLSNGFVIISLINWTVPAIRGYITI
jgi:hypothetical protein